MPSMVTHKVFGSIGYNFADCDRWYNPYLGIGGELEVDGLVLFRALLAQSVGYLDQRRA